MTSLKIFLGRLFADSSFLALVVFSILTALVSFRLAHSKEVRTVRLDQTTVARIYIAPGRSTILSFPSKPAKVILGNQGVFAVEYVENDLALAALSTRAHSDLFVYVEGRRFAFDLVVVRDGADTIVLVRDAAEEPKLVEKPAGVEKTGPKTHTKKLRGKRNE